MIAQGRTCLLELGRWEKETSCLKIANNEITKFGISFMHAIIKDLDSQFFFVNLEWVEKERNYKASESLMFIYSCGEGDDRLCCGPSQSLQATWRNVEEDPQSGTGDFSYSKALICSITPIVSM